MPPELFREKIFVEGESLRGSEVLRILDKMREREEEELTDEEAERLATMRESGFGRSTQDRITELLGM